MTLGEKISSSRMAAGLSQQQLADRAQLTLRAIQYYEKDERTPQTDNLQKIAAALDMPLEYFLSDTSMGNAQFVSDARDKYGYHGQKQAEQLLAQTSALFAGGELDEQTQQAFQNAMMEIFNDAKGRNKKYSKKKKDKPKLNV